jgi:Spy/CpxP family protein refolding chaperone
VSSALSGITSSLSISQSNSTSSISIPSDLTPAEEAEVQSILGQLASGSITAAQAQAEISAVTSSAQTQTQSTQGQGTQGTQPHHHHHHGKPPDGADGTSPAQTLATALDLTSDQQSQIASIVQTAQQNGTDPATVLSQIDSVLTPEQQQKLAQLLSPTYSSVGTNSTGSQPPLFSTTA